MTLTSQEQHWTLEGNRTPSLKFWKNKKYFQLRIVYLAKLPIKREGTFLLIQDRSYSTDLKDIHDMWFAYTEVSSIFKGIRSAR